MSRSERSREDALDVLEHEDQRLRVLFKRLDATTGSNVQERSEHGVLSKQLIRSIALREAAKTDIADALSGVQEWDQLRRRMQGAPTERRQAISQLDRLARRVTAMDLNKGQDFDEAMSTLRHVVDPEVRWELAEGIASLRATMTPEQRARSLHSARHLRKHAPTSVDPHGARWYEHRGPVARFLTTWDYLQDRPRPVRLSREQVEVHEPEA